MANIVLRKPLSRRTLLRGAGYSLALPFLDSMVKPTFAQSEQMAAPKRFAVLWMPNGVRADQWTPTTEGEDYALSPTLQPLADIKSDVSVYTNLWHQNTDTGDGHYVKCSGFLTGTTIHKTVGVDLNANGISLDQVIAQSKGTDTPLASMELGTEPVRTGVDKAVGYTRVYGAHISWKAPTVPLAKEINPRLAFERLFRLSQQEIGARNARDRRLLDTILEDANALHQRLGSADKRRLDEYLESVSSIEQRIRKLESRHESKWTPNATLQVDAIPNTEPESHAIRVRLMLDIIAMAFQSDVTRVSTFMFGNSVSDISFSFLDGVDGTHHGMSHHENNEDKLRQYQLINRWHVEQFAYLADKLKHMPEGDSNVLDNSLVLFGAGLRDGNSHSPHNLPILVAGKAGGRVRSGVHASYQPDTPLSNLYLGMLHALDIEAKSFADSTEVLPGVLI